MQRGYVYIRVIDEEKQIDDSQRCVCTDIHTFNYTYGIIVVCLIVYALSCAIPI